MNLIIREQTDADSAAVYAVNSTAFPSEDEARLVEQLRAQAKPCYSLVAELIDKPEKQSPTTSSKIIGHILFSPVELENYSNLKLMGLAPMAVLPEHQNKNIGSQLVEAGLQHCRENEMGAVVVLGHPEYYPRFGFKPASHFDTKSEYDVPDEVFLVLELTPSYLSEHSGTFRYHPAFSNL